MQPQRPDDSAAHLDTLNPLGLKMVVFGGYL